jgi:Domain of unknown function (DUF4282)
MASVPSYIHQQAVPSGRGIVESLLDFSFERLVTPQVLKLLYGVHLLLGLIVGTALVVKGFDASASNGLLTLMLVLVGMAFWVVYCRIVVELLSAFFRAAAVITTTDR